MGNLCYTWDDVLLYQNLNTFTIKTKPWLLERQPFRQFSLWLWEWKKTKNKKNLLLRLLNSIWCTILPPDLYFVIRQVGFLWQILTAMHDLSTKPMVETHHYACTEELWATLIKMCDLFFWSLKCGLNGKSLPLVWILQIYRTISLLKMLRAVSNHHAKHHYLKKKKEKNNFKLSTSMQMKATLGIASVFVKPDINKTKMKHYILFWQ